MNRKNTILVSVLINAGLLAVLFVVALTSQDEGIPSSEIASDVVRPLPKFDDKIGSVEALPLRTVPVDPATTVEIPLPAPEEVAVHKLPPQVLENIPPPAPPIVSPFASCIEVIVKKGDSLEKIAKANQTSVDEIIKANHLSNTFLKIGQVLKIPTERTLATAPKLAETKRPVEGGPEYYTMKVGDNTWAIAMKHHMKVDELLRLNGLNEEKARKLKPGDRLRIR